MTARKVTKKKALSDFWKISCWRLYLLSFFSFGLYELYWAYKNWQCVKLAKQEPTDEKISPIWRGWILSFVWFLPLCSRIIKRYGANFRSYMMWAMIYFICFYATFFYLNDIVIFVLLRALTPLFLLPIQRLINRNCDKTNKVFCWDFVISFVGLLLMIFLPAYYQISGLTRVLNMEEDKQQSFFAVSGIIYRYTTVYNDVCQENGVNLDRYQQVFNEQFAEQIGIVNKILNKGGVSFNNFMNIMLDDEGRKEAKETVADEIENLRKLFILKMLADKGDVEAADENWKDAYDSYLSLKETCEMINEHAENVIKIIGVDRMLFLYGENL